MSCYEWEEGTLTLPSAAVAAVKKAVREENNRLHDAVLARAKEIHRGFGTTSPAAYRAKLEAATTEAWGSSSSYGSRREFDRLVTRVALGFLEQRLWANGRGQRPARVARVTVPTVADLAAFGLPKATNKTAHFTVIGNQYAVPGEAGISFEGRTVTWFVGENNHAVETARDSRMAGVFFNALANVTWTRGTGGTIVGNNEYNRDDRSSTGGGGNYLVEAYGPVGHEAQVADYMRQGMSRAAAERVLSDVARDRSRFGARW